MKTIAFYSYKGGSGRSLTLAVFARALSRIGKNVCIIDFDFEAPGLQYKFGVNKAIKRGFVDYLCRCHDVLESQKDLDAHKVQMTIKSLLKYSLRLEQVSGSGWIRLIPSGNVESDTYWNRVNESIPALFGFTVADNDTTERIRAANNRLRLFDRIKETIEDTIRPDYLLVDSRSGVMERVGICTRLWADDVVCFVVPNRESVVGTRKLLRGLIASGRVPYHPGQKPIKPIVALNRVPKHSDQWAQLCDQTVQEVKEFLTKPWNENPRGSVKLDQLHSLAHDMMVSVDERIVLGWVDKWKDTPLSRDYLDLFKSLVLPADRDTISRIPVQATTVARLFEQNIQTGDLRNPADRARNVAFRVDTFSNVLVQMAKYLKDEEVRLGVRETTATRNAEVSLEDAGLSCGANFARQLLAKWQDEKGKCDLTLERRLEEWCLFDSDVGFGLFKSSLRKSKPLVGEIRLLNSFLHDTRRQYRVNILAFVKGYVGGIVATLTDGVAQVTKMRIRTHSTGVGSRVDLVFALEGK